MHINPPSAGGRSSVRRIALRALEPDAVRPHRAAFSHITPKRAEHIQPCERRRERHVPPLARL